MTDDDEQERRLLREGDPAGPLQPLSADAIDRLVRDAVAAGRLADDPEPQLQSVFRRRRGLVAVLGAAAAAGVAAAVVVPATLSAGGVTRIGVTPARRWPAPRSTSTPRPAPTSPSAPR